jgi:serine/threonine protein kinase
MSRVFLAEEARLSRQVVVKVLPPETSAGVNVERFEREIQLAARLQHPHIVPLLTAGASGVESLALAPSCARLNGLYEAKGKRERLGRLAQEPGT